MPYTNVRKEKVLCLPGGQVIDVTVADRHWLDYDNKPQVSTYFFHEYQLRPDGNPKGNCKGVNLGIRASRYPAGHLDGTYVIDQPEKARYASIIRQQIMDLEAALNAAKQALRELYATPETIAEALLLKQENASLIASRKEQE